MKNVILCLAFSLLTLSTLAGRSYELIYKETKHGNMIIAVRNYTNRTIYCSISGENYFVDFNVSPRSIGRWYNEPNVNYNLRCE